MNNNTRIRLHLSKGLFESIAQEVLTEAKKGDMSGGAYTEVVKQPKQPKAEKETKTEAGAPPVPPVKPKMPPVPSQKPKMPPVPPASSSKPKVPPVPPAPGQKPKMPPVPGQKSEMETRVAEEGQINEYIGLSPEEVKSLEWLAAAVASGTGAAIVSQYGKEIKDLAHKAMKAIKMKKSASADKPVEEAKKELKKEDLRKGVFNDFEKWKASFPEDAEFKNQNNYVMVFDKTGKELGKWNPSSKTGMHATDFQYKSL